MCVDVCTRVWICASVQVRVDVCKRVESVGVQVCKYVGENQFSKVSALLIESCTMAILHMGGYD